MKTTHKKLPKALVEKCYLPWENLLEIRSYSRAIISVRTAAQARLLARCANMSEEARVTFAHNIFWNAKVNTTREGFAAALRALGFGGNQP